MTTNRTSARRVALALLIALAATPALAARYTYHGELLDGESPAEGRFDLRVRALADPGAKHALGEAIELPGVAVVDGGFAIELDLPEQRFGDLYVEVALRRTDSGDAFATLGDAQKIEKANTGCWALDGNTGVPAGSFLGIADPASTAPLALRARNAAVARFTPFGAASNHGDAPSVVLGSPQNLGNFAGATVAGGGSTRDGGVPCLTCGQIAGDEFATVGGGGGNSALGPYSTVAGGRINTAGAEGSVVAGGTLNWASGDWSNVAGGLQNGAVGVASAVANGALNCAGGTSSWAGGRFAIVRHGTEGSPTGTQCVGRSSGDADGDEGTFVWSDTNSANGFVSTGRDQFLIRAQGGVAINTAPPVSSVELTVQTDADDGDYANLWLKQKAASNNGILISVGDGTGSNNAGFYVDHYTGAAQARRMELSPNGSVTIRSNTTQAASGVTMAAGAGAWSSLSDRNLKTAIAAVDPRAILDRLIATPIATWSYRTQRDVRHIGPMAQDFSATFGVGENDTTISTVDADGVALAAIQGLNAKLERENAALRDALAAQRALLDAVTQRLERLETGR